jgi:hypothetical protein
MKVCISDSNPSCSCHERRRAAARSARAIALLGVALVIAACGNSGDGGATAATPGSGSAGSSSQSGASVEDQLGFDEAGILARQSRVEAAIAQCMKNEGFDYIPIDPFAQRAALVGSSRLSDQDFLKQFGYGISTLWGRGNPQADPNQRLRATLGPADRRAYDRALWGDNKGTTFSDAVDSGQFDRLGGCTLKATESVFGGAQVLTQLQGKLDDLDDRINEDRRMVKAIAKWSDCMAQAGYRYEDPDEIDADLFRRTEKIVGPLPGQFATGPPAGEKPRPFDHAALAKLQHDEVAIAVRDSACEVKQITPVESVVRPEYEARFRDRNRGLISQIRPVR